MIIILCLLVNVVVTTIISENDLKCSKKLLVTVTIENGQMAATESIQITQTSNGTILESPITITMTKSPVLALYPLKYIQDFNSQPIEQIISTTVLGCKDEAYAAQPTCGWQLDSKGHQIFASQGYCCACSFSQIIGVDNENLSRGKICSAFNLGSGSATAHCLRYSNLWYSAFNIQMYTIYYEIKISIKMNDSFTQNISIGSTKFVAKTPQMIARLIGDFSPLSPPETFESIYLFKPSMPVTDARVQEGSRAWMFIPEVMVSRDSSECNKIGVGYTAFQNEQKACGNPVGSCLKNQLEILYQQDLLLISQNKQPEYLLSSQGIFSGVTDATQTYLMQEIQGKMPTMITLEIDADAVRFIINVGEGQIDVARVQDFEAHSGNGILYVQISNTGQLASEFQTSINCSVEVGSMQGRTLFLNPLASTSFTERVDVSGDLGKNYTCLVSLYNNLGTLLDLKKLNFSTTAMEHHNDQSNTTLTNKSSVGSVGQPIPPRASCDSICSNFWDFYCFYQNNCSQQMYKFSSIIIIIMLSLMCCCGIYKFRKRICKKKRKSRYIHESIIPSRHIQQSIAPQRQVQESIIIPRRTKSIAFQPTKFQSSILQPNNLSITIQAEERIYVELVYANLIDGTDSLATKIGHNISIPLIAYKQQNLLVKIKLDDSSQVHQIIKRIYGKQWRGVLVEYLQTIRQNSNSYPQLLTKSPRFQIV